MRHMPPLAVWGSGVRTPSAPLPNRIQKRPLTCEMRLAGDLVSLSVVDSDTQAWSKTGARPLTLFKQVRMLLQAGVEREVTCAFRASLGARVVRVLPVRSPAADRRQVCPADKAGGLHQQLRAASHTMPVATTTHRPVWLAGATVTRCYSFRHGEVAVDVLARVLNCGNGSTRSADRPRWAAPRSRQSSPRPTCSSLPRSPATSPGRCSA
jgi:hypothetical protein